MQTGGLFIMTSLIQILNFLARVNLFACSQIQTTKSVAGVGSTVTEHNVYKNRLLFKNRLVIFIAVTCLICL